MVNSLSVKISQIEKENRFNPKYFSFLNHSETLIKESKHKFVKLGDKTYFPVLSDGIHTAVELIPSGEIKYLYILRYLIFLYRINNKINKSRCQTQFIQTLTLINS